MAYKIVHNVLSDQTLSELREYYEIRETDENSHYAWDPKVTQNGTIPESYTMQIEGKLRTLIDYELYSRSESPFYMMKEVKHCDMALYKYPKGCWVPFHIDKCIGSLTLFLNETWDEKDGGHFQWYNSQRLIQIPPSYNNGVSILFDAQQSTPEHGVTIVEAEYSHRFTLQVFLRKPGDVQISYGNHYKNPEQA